MQQVALILSLLGALVAIVGGVGKFVNSKNPKSATWWMPALVGGLAGFGLGIVLKLIAA